MRKRKQRKNKIKTKINLQWLQFIIKLWYFGARRDTRVKTGGLFDRGAGTRDAWYAHVLLLRGPSPRRNPTANRRQRRYVVRQSALPMCGCSFPITNTFNFSKIMTHLHKLNVFSRSTWLCFCNFHLIDHKLLWSKHIVYKIQ